MSLSPELRMPILLMHLLPDYLLMLSHHVFEYQVELLRHPLFGDTPIKSSIGSPTAFASLSVLPSGCHSLNVRWKFAAKLSPLVWRKGCHCPKQGNISSLTRWVRPGQLSFCSQCQGARPIITSAGQFGHSRRAKLLRYCELDFCWFLCL